MRGVPNGRPKLRLDLVSRLVARASETTSESASSVFVFRELDQPWNRTAGADDGVMLLRNLKEV